MTMRGRGLTLPPPGGTIGATLAQEPLVPPAHSLVALPSLAASLLVTMAAAPLVHAQEVPVRPAEIAVSATGESHATPDRVMVTLGVESRASTAGAAARANAATQRAVLDTLRKMGLRDDQLTTANFNVRPEYDAGRERQGPPRVTGYVVSNTVQATIEDVARAGQVLDAALAKGANTVYGMYLTLSDPVPARLEALAAAVKTARGEAETLARAAGGSLGRILEVTTFAGGSAPRAMPRVAVAGGMAAGLASTSIEPGQATVTAVVTMRWELVR